MTEKNGRAATKYVAFRLISRILVAGGMAFALVVLVLGTLGAAAKTKQITGRANFPQANIAQEEATAASPQAFLPSWQEEVITTTFLNPDMPLPPNQSPPEGSSVEVNESPWPDWVIEMMNADTLQVGASSTSVNVIKTVKTNHPQSPTFVYNGQRITYTILVSNTGSPITGTTIFDLLPVGTLGKDFTYSVAPPILTGTVTTDAAGNPTQVTWEDSEPITTSRVYTFAGTVVCQPNNTTFENQVVATFFQGGSSDADNDQVATTALLQVEPNGAAVMASEAPTLCSDENFTLDLDWGDFDHDGDLDLALAASVDGVKVYRNEGGQFNLFWPGDPGRFDFAAGVFWADVNDDDNLELAILGHDDEPGSAVGGTGHNYIYKLGTGQFDFMDQFDSDRALYRAVFGHFNNDDYLDIVAIRFYLLESGDNNGCQAVLYRNDGAGDNRFSIGNSTCIMSDDSWVKSIAAGDYDNNGNLDLAIGGGPNQASSGAARNRIYRQDSLGSFTEILFEDFYPAYALDWGDYNGDGYLDLAAGFSGEYKARIYPNNVGVINASTHLQLDLEMDPFNGSVVRSVGWGDFTGDGRLELALGTGPFGSGFPPIIYEYDPSTITFTPIITMADLFNSFTLWRVRAVDYDNDSDLDVSFSNSGQLGSYFSGGPSLLFTNFAPFLTPTLTPIEHPDGEFSTMPASSVAWGDAVGSVSGADGWLDLLFGAGPVGGGEQSFLTSKLYENVNGSFPRANATQFGFVGPHYVAFGDVNGDGELDTVLATPTQNEIYLNGSVGTPWRSGTSLKSQNLALVDVDLDNNGRLDLLVGNDGPNELFLNPSLQSTLSDPDWQSAITDNTRSIAWGYFDDDIFPDFAVGNDGQINRIYRNNGGKSFTLANWAPSITNDATRSVAWADYDRDGDMDLAVGNYGQPNYIYENVGGGLSQTPVWTSTNIDGTPLMRKTTSLAWGDWNNDGAPDLAVGNDGEKDQVYANFGSKGGPPHLVWLWQSNETYQTTGVAWGDMDNDGDLDLAISQDGSDKNGIYENTYVLASNLNNGKFLEAMPLPQNPSYIFIAQPGNPGQVFSRTLPLTNSNNLTIPIRFTVYDPDGRRNQDNPFGDKVEVLKYEYSLDGSQWYETNNIIPVSPNPFPDPLSTQRRGRNYSFIWQAGKDLGTNNPDQPVSDNVRFRIIIAHLNKTGPSQRASTNAVSPPFRVRNLTCVWPDNAAIVFQTPITPRVPAVFTGTISTGQGQVIFNWNFGDNTGTQQGQIVQHEYMASGTYPITLTVTGPACPVARKSVAFATVTVGQQFVGPGTIYLPIILKSGTGSGTTGIPSEPETLIGTPTPTSEPEGVLFTLDNAAGTPAQVTGLLGKVQLAGTTLEWSPSSPNETVLGYRVYRAATGTTSFRLVADVPSGVTTYTDDTATCGQMYFVTAYNAAGESLPSTASYFSPPCR